MTAKHSPSRMQAPAAVSGADLYRKDQVDPIAGGGVPLGSLYRPMTGVWPAVDATNGPLTADAGMSSTAPSFTGMTEYKWNSGKFNTQSQNWVAVPANSLSSGLAANQCCQNTITNSRGSNYASSGIGFPCHIDFSFVADTAKIILVYYQTTSFAAALGTATANHESQIFAEHEGQMRAIRSVPNAWPNGSGGNAMYYRVITFSQAKRREFRIMMSAGCWLEGVYIDTGGMIAKAPNRPVLISHFGDSWAEGTQNVWSSVGGNGANAGTTWPTGCSLLYSNTAIQFAIATGFAVGIHNQGGTGYFNTNSSSIDVDAATGSTTGFTSFLAQLEVDDWFTNFGSKYPTVFCRGGWNDGTTPCATPYLTNYQARVDHVLRKVLAKRSNTPIMVEGIQCKSIGVGDGRDLSNQGIAAAVAALKADSAGYKILGFIDNFAQLYTGSAYTDLGSANIGPDGLHPTVKGGDYIGQNAAEAAALFVTDRNYVNLTLAA